MRRPNDDYNTGWRSVLRPMLGYLFAFFFPEVHSTVDWDRPIEFLDQEMEHAVRLAGKGRKAVDALIKVWLKSGEEVWMLLHLEFQNQVEQTFPERMFGYNVTSFASSVIDGMRILGAATTALRMGLLGLNCTGMAKK